MDFKLLSVVEGLTILADKVDYIEVAYPEGALFMLMPNIAALEEVASKV